MLNSSSRSKNLIFGKIVGLVPLVVIVVFYWLSVKYSINIPWFDDIENIPYFLINFIKAPTWLDKWQTIIFPNNEHRVLTARMIVLVQYFLSGHLNFRVLSFCGNLSVLFLFGFIARGYLRQQGKWYLLIPVAFFIFNFQSYSGIFMTIMSMQYQMVILLSVASFYFLSKRGIMFLVLAILIAYIDTFSMGNGMMVWPSGIVLLLFQARWKEAVLWTVMGAAAIYLYFHGYDFVQGNDKAFTYITEYPFRTFLAFFTMLGGDFDIFPHKPFERRMLVPTLTGLVLFAVFIFWLIGILSTSSYWSRRIPYWIKDRFLIFPSLQGRNNRWNAFWLGTLVYVMISMLLVVVFRTRFDPHIILGSTYKMYPSVMTSVIYIVAIQLFTLNRQPYFFLLSVLVSAGVWLSTLVNYLPVIREISMGRTAFAFNQKKNGVGLGATKNSVFEKMLATTLAKVDSMGIYSLPDPLIHRDENRIDLGNVPGSALTNVEIDSSRDILNVKPVDWHEAAGTSYIILQSSDNQYLFVMPENGGPAVCPKGTIRRGNYAIGVWTVSKDRTKVQKTGQVITID